MYVVLVYDIRQTIMGRNAGRMCLKFVKSI